MKTQLILLFGLFLLLTPVSFSQSTIGMPGVGITGGGTGMRMRCVSPMPRVTGAPCSLVRESEETRPWRDGTHKVFTTMTRLYRDSQGRTREERFMPVPAGAPQDLKWLTIIIHDPVAGVRYMFNLREHVAIRAVCSPTPRNGSAESAARPLVESLSKTISDSEPLGTQMIEGILAEGERRTTAYPVGTAGNEQAFVSVIEKWVSTELGIPLLVKASDPRTGETTDRVTKLDRSEPDASLFQPPPDYTIQDQ